MAGACIRYIMLFEVKSHLEHGFSSKVNVVISE